MEVSSACIAIDIYVETTLQVLRQRAIAIVNALG